MTSLKYQKPRPQTFKDMILLMLVKQVVFFHKQSELMIVGVTVIFESHTKHTKYKCAGMLRN